MARQDGRHWVVIRAFRFERTLSGNAQQRKLIQQQHFFGHPADNPMSTLGKPSVNLMSTLPNKKRRATVRNYVRSESKDLYVPAWGREDRAFQFFGVLFRFFGVCTSKSRRLNSAGVEKRSTGVDSGPAGEVRFRVGLAMSEGYPASAAARAYAQVLGPLWRASQCAWSPHGDSFSPCRDKRRRQGWKAAAPGAGLAVIHRMTMPAVHRGTHRFWSAGFSTRTAETSTRCLGVRRVRGLTGALGAMDGRGDVV